MRIEHKKSYYCLARHKRDYINISVNDNDIYSRLKGIPASVTSQQFLN